MTPAHPALGEGWQSAMDRSRPPASGQRAPARDLREPAAMELHARAHEARASPMRDAAVALDVSPPRHAAVRLNIGG